MLIRGGSADGLTSEGPGCGLNVKKKTLLNVLNVPSLVSSVWFHVHAFNQLVHRYA